MKTPKPLSEKELLKLEESRNPSAEAIAGLKDYKRGRALGEAYEPGVVEVLHDRCRPKTRAHQRSFPCA